MGIAIERQLTDAGYRMFGDTADIERLIQSILKTNDIRYLKAIPFLIYKHKIDILHIAIKHKENKDLFNAIIILTAQLLNELNIKGILPKYFEEKRKNFFENDSKLIKEIGRASCRERV